MGHLLISSTRLAGFFCGALLLAGCSGDGERGSGRGGGSGANGNNGLDGDLNGGLNGDNPLDPGGNGGSTIEGDPKTCAEAENARTYVGCEFWPTITANPVWVDFKPAVVVTNGSEETAQITVTGPNGFQTEESIPPGELKAIMLDWVDALKGPEYKRTDPGATSEGRLKDSAFVAKGAYKMTSSVPVTAWQFNPLNYLGNCAGIGECRAASNDASLLLPATAMTGNYRVFAYSTKDEGAAWGSVPGGFAITATRDGTEVTVQLGPNCGSQTWNPPNLGGCVASGPGVEAKNAGDIYTFQMNAGDVAQLVGEWGGSFDLLHADVSGSIVNATKPVQVVAFNAITQLPDAVANADHIEETVLPAEVIGKKYIVVPPTTPNGDAVGHVVRIYGNVDNTQLTYPEGKPTGAPDVINAGEMVQLSTASCSKAACMVKEPFIVEGDQPFAVMSFMVGGTLQMPGTDPTNSKGDPGMSQMVAPDQFRKSYTFLAPDDYSENFAELIIPNGAEVTLDDAPLTAPVVPIGGSGWSYARVPLPAGSNGGVHRVSTTHEQGLGLQVSGFGFATSYYYPGGLNLELISEPPVIVVK